MNGSIFPRPAVLIILLMVVINAGIFFYFDHKSDVADQKLENQIEKNEAIAEENRGLIRKQEKERLTRTDQNCEFAERTHLRDVQALEGTYKYLEQAEADPSEKNTILYRLVVSTLPQTIAAGEIDVAPDYCDATGYGLKEPDPETPPRPEFLSESINKQADQLKTNGAKLDERPIIPDVK